MRWHGCYCLIRWDAEQASRIGAKQTALWTASAVKTVAFVHSFMKSYRAKYFGAREQAVSQRMHVAEAFRYFSMSGTHPPTKDKSMKTRRISRQFLLRGAGVVVALPALDCMMPAAVARNAQLKPPRRMVAINMELSFHPPNLMPTKSGGDDETTRYLEPLSDLRADFTIISGTSHPEVDGGHAASQSWLTGAVHPGTANFRNSISIDQLAAREIGLQTRLAYMALGGGGISVSANGVKIRGAPYPSHFFRKMFLDGRPHEKARQIERLQEGRSVLDTVLEAVRRMRSRVGQRDKQKLDEYFTSVRKAEQQLRKFEHWQQKPKPEVDAELPSDIRDHTRLIERARQLYDIMYLTIQTDSTRLITYTIGDSSHVPQLPEIDRGKRRAWNQLPEKQRRRDSAKMETHAAMIDRLDQGLGDVITALKLTGQFENTLIVFLADNGASPEEPVRPGYDRPSETPDGRTIRYTGTFPPEELGRDDTWTGLGPALANACNTPFRFWKKESYHGGCASPFIVHWPAGHVGQSADPSSDGRTTADGRITDQVSHVVDLLPTFLDAAGIDATDYNSRGKSLLPVFKGRTRDGHDGLFFEHSGGAAHRAGNWKIVRLKPNRPWALYDLSCDRTETTDLAKQYDERVQSMAAAWNDWWQDVTGEKLP